MNFLSFMNFHFSDYVTGISLATMDFFKFGRFETYLTLIKKCLRPLTGTVFGTRPT
jgi:hypothetical protein